MTRVEAPLLEVEKRDEISIGRVVAPAPLPVEVLGRRLRIARSQGVSLNDINFSEVVLIQKSEASIPSANLVMPFGGEIGEGESIFHGAVRELAEETVALPSAVKKAERQWQANASHDASFVYGILGYAQPRRVHTIVLPVESGSFSLHKPREGINGSEDKIARTITLSPHEMRQLITEGIIQRGSKILQAAGNFRITDGDIIISDSEKDARAVILCQVIEEVENFDRVLKRSTLYAVNKIRQHKKMDFIKNLSDCSDYEIIEGFIAAQMLMGLYDERKGNKPPTKDVYLKAINYLVPKGVALESYVNFLPFLATEVTEPALNTIQWGLSRGIKVILSEMEPQYQATLEKINGTDTVKALERIWPKVVTLPVTKRIALLQRADDAMTEEIASLTKMSPYDVTLALSEALQFHDFITKSLQRHPDFQRGIFQEHRPRNEVTNASLFTLGIMALGLDPDRNVALNKKAGEGYRRLRFESMRSLAVFATALEALQTIQAVDNRIFQAAIDTMFDEPVDTIMDVGEGKHYTLHRRTVATIEGKRRAVIIDQRERKTILSATRKKFQDPELNDVHTMNIVLADTNFVGEENTIDARLRIGDQIPDLLVQHIQREIDRDPDSNLRVSIVPGTRRRENLDQIQASLQSSSRQIFPASSVDESVNLFKPDIPPAIDGGKRAGSQGNRFLRDKFILAIYKNHTPVELIEVNIYPIQSTHSPGLETLGETNYWGFAEKLDDDRTGTYGAGRIIERNNPAEPSLYELLYRANIYEEISRPLVKSHVRSRKPTNTAA